MLDLHTIGRRHFEALMLAARYERNGNTRQAIMWRAIAAKIWRMA